MEVDHYHHLLVWLLQQQAHRQRLNKTASLELVLLLEHHIHSMVASFFQTHLEDHQMMKVVLHMVHCYLVEHYLENHQNLNSVD
jgi:hypothetical protein